MHHPTRIPHFLRLTIVLLRVVLGLHFFALGFGRLFHSSLFPAPSINSSFAGISRLLIALDGSPLFVGVLAWTLLVVGAGLIIGLRTRLCSFVAALIAGSAYVRDLAFPTTLLAGILNDQLIVLLSLGVLFFGRAGSYLGFDTLFHFSFWRKR